MSEIVETVKIDTPDAPGGHTVINKSDFDPKTQKLWVEPKPTPKVETEAGPQTRK